MTKREWEERRRETMDIYAKLKDAGVPLDNHYSDLYAKATLECRAILKENPEVHASSFVSNLDGAIWFDIPFGFTPYLDAKQAKA